VYVDRIWIQEELGGNSLGPNIIYKPWMAHHLYFDQRNSYAFDKVLELANQHGIFLRPVVMEKNDPILSHIDFDGHYQVACVPVARDAGLGEVGRLSILINPSYGPCIRLAVVTTNLELEETASKNHHIEEFCDICKKCAENCPSKSIPFHEKPAERGFPHWSIDMESCYTFWKRMGTDCGICIRVCPYTKSNTLIHKLARFYVSRNPINQRIALFLDHMLYGLKIDIPTSNPEKSSMLA